MQFREKEGRDPDAVVITNAGGGNLTGTARGLLKAGAVDTKIIAASVSLEGLHMASDTQFNKNLSLQAILVSVSHLPLGLIDLTCQDQLLDHLDI